MPKQVIIIRKDLRMRRGKEIAQGAHASMGAYFDAEDKAHFSKRVKDALTQWLVGSFTKITLQVQSEEELISVYEQASRVGLPCALITDSGLTEFNNVPTRTALAIGPALSEDIDQITGLLKLY